MLALCASCVACANAASDDSGTIGTAGATGGAPPAPELSIQFQDTPIRVLPREERRVTVKVSPAGAYPVRFALLGAQTETTQGDAALDRSEVLSDASGLASVVLTAPSDSIDFRLRAQVGAVSTTASISVIPGALVNLSVSPSYAGTRDVTEWIASVHVGMGCEDFADSVISDSPLLVRGPKDAPLRLEDIPAADKLAVTLRANSFARGCTTVLHPPPEVDTEVIVTVTDQPIDLTATNLEISLGIDAKDASFTAELDAALASIQAAMVGGAANELVALLDDMQAELKAGIASKFAVARARAAWDDSVPSLMGRGADTRLGEAIARYGRIGRGSLFSPQAFEGRLAAAGDVAVPSLTLERVGGVAVDEVGLSGEASSWNVDTSDTLAFAANFSWSSSALLAALSVAPANAETGAKDVPGALAEVLSCEQLANSLSGGSNDAVAELVAVCPVACLQTSCEAALARMWARASLASDYTPTEMSVLATGKATVGPERQPSELHGSWVGRLTHPSGTSQSGGSLEAYEPR